MAEQGFPGFECTSWYAFLGPAQVPEEIVRKIYADLRATLRMPDVRERLYNSGLDLLDQPPEEIRRVMIADYGKWAEVIRRAGIRL